MIFTIDPILEEILFYLDLADILALEQVNKQLFCIIRQNKIIWCRLCLSKYAAKIRSLDILNLVNRSIYLTVLELDGIEYIGEDVLISVLIKSAETLRELSINLLRFKDYEAEYVEVKCRTAAEKLARPKSPFQVSTNLVQVLPPRLEKLYLAHRPINKMAFNLLVQRLQFLKRLDLRMTGIDNEDLQILLKERGLTLEELKLAELPLSDLSLICFTLYGRNIKYLDLDYCFPQGTTRKVASILAVMNFESLSLTRITFTNVDLLFEKIKRCKALTLSPWEFLLMRDSHLDMKASFTALANSINFDALTELRLFRCVFLTDVDFCNIIGARRSSLKVIDIRWCPLIGVTSFKAVLELKLEKLTVLIMQDLLKLANERCLGKILKESLTKPNRKLKLVSFRHSVSPHGDSIIQAIIKENFPNAKTFLL